jgi:large subunit ribosomal protein L29
MKAKDMREKSPEDLRELEKSLARDAFQAKLKNFTNRLDDTSQIRKLHRDLARVKTLLVELHRPSRTGNQPKSPAPSKPAVASKAKAVTAAAKSSPKVGAAAKKPAAKTKTAKSAKSEAGK